MVSYDDIEPTEKIKIYEKNISFDPKSVTPFSPAYRSGDILIPHLKQAEALQTELSHFIDCIKKKKTPISDGESGVRVIKTLEAADRSLRSGKAVTLSL